MTNALGFDALKGILHRRIHQLPDHRKPGPNTRYTIKDAALGAFGVFYTQSPSFLEYQHHLQQAKGQNNACTLFGVEQIPCNNQVRTCSIRSCQVTSMGCILRSLRALSNTAC